MRPGLMIGARHVVRYTVPVHQTVPDLMPALAEFRRGQPVFATGFMVGLMEAPFMAAVYPYLEPGEVDRSPSPASTACGPSMPRGSVLAWPPSRPSSPAPAHLRFPGTPAARTPAIAPVSGGPIVASPATPRRFIQP